MTKLQVVLNGLNALLLNLVLVLNQADFEGCQNRKGLVAQDVILRHIHHFHLDGVLAVIVLSTFYFGARGTGVGQVTHRDTPAQALGVVLGRLAQLTVVRSTVEDIQTRATLLRTYAGRREDEL